MTAGERTRPHPESLPVGALLTALVALGQISTSIYIPSMPSIAAEFSSTPAHVNLTLSGFLLGFAVSQLLFGPASDRFGRRPVLFAGLGLYLAASVLCALASGIEMLIVGRVLQGMAACAGPVLGRAIVRDVYGAERTAAAMAWIGAALAVSPAVAPIIGGYLQEWFGWRASFVFLMLVGIVLFAATGWLLSETSPRHGPGGGAPELHLAADGFATTFLRLLADRRFLGYTLCVAFIFAGLMAYAAGGPFVFITLLGLSPSGYGMLAVFPVAGYLAGSIAAGRLSRRVPVARLTAAGLAISLCGGLGLVVPAAVAEPSVAAVVVPMMLFTAGLGIVLPTGMAGAMAPWPRVAGAASALLGCVQMLVAAGASLAAGLLPAVSALPMAAVITASAGLAAAAFIALVRCGPSPGH